MIARFLFAPPEKALIVPSSVAKMKLAPLPSISKSVDDPLLTTPVGVPGPFRPVGETGPFPAVGIKTLSDCGVPVAL